MHTRSSQAYIYMTADYYSLWTLTVGGPAKFFTDVLIFLNFVLLWCTENIKVQERPNFRVVRYQWRRNKLKMFDCDPCRRWVQELSTFSSKLHAGGMAVSIVTVFTYCSIASTLVHLSQVSRTASASAAPLFINHEQAAHYSQSDDLQSRFISQSQLLRTQLGFCLHKPVIALYEV